MAFLSGLLPIVVALIVFGILVCVHEFGHFLFAKLNGVVVHEFAIGMGPKFFAKQGKETLYTLRILPLGGYCKMMGEDTDDYEEGSFNNKGVVARFLIIAAGAIFNFILAFVIVFILLGLNGYATNGVGTVIPDYGAEAAGMLPGDIILAVDGQSVFDNESLAFALYDAARGEVEVKVNRNGEIINLVVLPMVSSESGSYILGIQSQYKTGAFDSAVDGYEQAGFFETLTIAVKRTGFYIKSTVIGFVRMITFNINKEDLAGPIGVVGIIGDSYTAGLEVSFFAALQNVARIAALISANLGAMNLLPLPALDGGRLVFLFIEAIRKKPVSPEKEGVVHFVGFVCLMALMVVFAYNDISRLFA